MSRANGVKPKGDLLAGGRHAGHGRVLRSLLWRLLLLSCSALPIRAQATLILDIARLDAEKGEVSRIHGADGDES